MNETVVLLADSKYAEKAKKLCEEFKCKYTEDEGSIKDTDIVLAYREEGLYLENDGQSMHGDFGKMKKRLMYNNLTHEMLVKTAKTKGVENPYAIDCTAGMGEDSLLLAAAGYRVTLFERDPIIAALLEDTIERALEDAELRNAAERMHLIKGDSISELAKITETPEVIVLDPMFPERTKSSLVKKKFQLLHLLEQPCMDEEELLQAALSTKARKIVIKRPLKGPYLADTKPSYSLSGKTVRYDCIVRA